jgi:hypothetical protein
MTWKAVGVRRCADRGCDGRAQAEPADGAVRLIERPYTAVIEVFMVGAEFAAEVPFSGRRATSTGSARSRSDLVWRNRMVGLDSVFGRIQGTLSLCVQVEWGVDADGAPAMTGMRYTDFIGTFDLPDGSTIDVEMAFQWEASTRTPASSSRATSWATGRRLRDGSRRQALYGSRPTAAGTTPRLSWPASSRSSASCRA